MIHKYYRYTDRIFFCKFRYRLKDWDKGLVIFVLDDVTQMQSTPNVSVEVHSTTYTTKTVIVGVDAQWTEMGH